MNTKRSYLYLVISAIFVIALFAALTTFTASADAPLDLYVDFSADEAAAGEDLVVTFALSQSDIASYKVAGLQIELSYDDTKLTPKSIESLLGDDSTAEYAFNNGKGIFVFVKKEFSDDAGYSALDNICKMTFTAKTSVVSSELFTENEVEYLFGDVMAKKIAGATLTVGTDEWFENQPDGEVYKDGVFIAYKGEAPEYVEIDEGTAEIGEGAFKGNTAVKYVYIPSSVTEIAADAFEGTTIVIVCDSNSDAAAFADANSITRTTFKEIKVTKNPSKLTYSNNEAFDPKGMEVTVYFNDDGSALTEDYTVSKINFQQSGSQALTVTYHEMTDTFNVIVSVKVVYGDANGDGKVSSSDIVRLKKYFAGLDPDTEESDVEIGPGADANGDGKISSSDIVRLKKYFAALDPDTGESPIQLGPDVPDEPINDPVVTGGDEGWSNDIR